MENYSKKKIKKEAIYMFQVSIDEDNSLEYMWDIEMPKAIWDVFFYLYLKNK